MRSMAVGVVTADVIAFGGEDAPLQIGMIGVHAGVVDIHDHAFASQAEIIAGDQGIGGDADANSA